MNKQIIGVILGLLLVSLISGFASSAGLEIISDKTVSIEKTEGQDYTFQINVANTENVDFYNITLESDNIEMSMFNLASGNNKTVDVKITSDEEFNETIKLVGYYYANLGTSNETEIVNVDYYDGFDRCNLNLIQGDSIKWVSSVIGSVKLKNEDTDEYFLTIPSESNNTKKFDYETKFNYRAYLGGTPFTEICEINIMASSGLVHNSAYDDELDLNVKVNYNPTEIEVTFLEDEYEIEAGDEEEDIFKIKNNGNNIARNIKISGNWFSFDLNNFNLNPGESKNIGYIISPIILNTNQTDLTYNRTIRITGNFDTIEKSFLIHIPYKELGDFSTNFTIDEDVLRNYLHLICSVFPEWSECKKNEDSESNRVVSIEINEETWKESQEAERNFQQEMKSQSKQQLENDIKQNKDIEDLKNETSNLKESIGDVNKNTDNILGFVVWGFVTISLIFLGFLIYSLAKSQGFLNKFKNNYGIASYEKY